MIQRYFTKPKRQEEFFSIFAREGVQAGIFLVLGFVFSRALLFKALSPMGISLCAALSGINLYACVAGAILGYSLGATASVAVKYIGAVVVLIFVKWLALYVKKTSVLRTVPPLSSGLGILLSGGILTIILTRDLYSVLSLLIEVALAVVGTILFSKGVEAISFRRPLCRMSVSEISGVVLMLGTVIVALSPVTVTDASLGVMLCVFLTLTVSLNSGALSGCVTGLLFGTCLLVCDESFLPVSLSLSFGGFLAGTFKDTGKGKMALIFAVSEVFISLLTLSESRLIPLLIETAAGCVLFLIFSFENDFLKNLSNPQAHSSNLKDFRAVFDRKMSLASDSLSEIGEITKKVSLKLQRRQEANEKKLFENTAEKVCTKCAMHDFCWENHKSDVQNAFESTAPKFREKGYISPENLPEYFSKNCIKSRELLHEINLSFSEAVEASAKSHELTAVRSVICEQFDAMALMLDKLKEELSSVRSVNGEVSDRFASSLRSLGLDVDYCCATARDLDRITVEVCVKEFEGESVPDKKLMKILSEICAREFDYPSIKTVDGRLHYVFNEKPCFDLDYKVLQTSVDGAVCGDCLGCFCDPEQFFNLILSDGMGAGKRAAVDSAMTVSLITKLIKSGFHYDNAVSVVNSAMLVKSSEETLSTVDALRLDLYTGKLQILKAGAAPTFIYSGGERVNVIEAESLPIGILGGVRPEKSEVYLKSGDLVVMVSDGICDDDTVWLETLILRHHNLPVRDLCDMIMREAVRENKNPDDRTVIAGRVICAK